MFKITTVDKREATFKKAFEAANLRFNEQVNYILKNRK